MRLLPRSFLHIADVEVEVCVDINSKYFVRHYTYWSIAYGKKNPDHVYDCVIDNLNIMTTNRLSTVKWAGHDFKFEKIAFDDGMEVETVLIPLKMFEDFIRYQAKNYRGEPPDNECTRLGKWLESKSLAELLTFSKI
jgi:hypothetical protein